MAEAMRDDEDEEVDPDDALAGKKPLNRWATANEEAAPTPATHERRVQLKAGGNCIRHQLGVRQCITHSTVAHPVCPDFPPFNKRFAGVGNGDTGTTFADSEMGPRCSGAVKFNTVNTAEGCCEMCRNLTWLGPRVGCLQLLR